MKSFKQMVNEVAKPISPDEQRFIDQHTYEVNKHPVALDHQHTGEIATKAGKAGTPADQKADTYDKAYAKKEARPAVETIGEEVELVENPMEEKPMMMGALRAMSHNMMGIAKYVQSTNDPEEWFQNKLAGVAKEMQTLYSYATAETMSGMATEEAIVETTSSALKRPVTQTGPDGKTRTVMKKTKADRSNQDGQDVIGTNENKQADLMKKLAKSAATSKKGKEAVTLKKAPWDKNEELSDKQKKIDHNKNGKIDGHDLAMLRKKKNEEVEQIDEISKNKMGQYIKRAHDDKDNQKKRASIFDKKGMDSDKDKDMYNNFAKADKAKKKAANRTKFIGKAVDRMTTESVELDEAMKFKVGAMKLKDGSQVVLKKEDANAMTQMFKDLSRQNQKKLGEVAMKDKVGFEEILGFAREAL